MEIIRGGEPEGFKAEALEARYDTFLERAAYEADSSFAEDLRFSTRIVAELQGKGYLTLAVGGYVRDVALARLNSEPLASKDIDIEVYGIDFDSLVPLLQPYGKVNLVGESFVSVKVTNPVTGKLLDFSIPRSDLKVDKGHKGFIITGDPTMTVREAAKRRDLTINAMALDPLTGELIDEHGGLNDLRAGILRATDHETYGEDTLRVLRLMQFAGRFNFVVDPATLELCKQLDLTDQPAERIGEEWIKLLTQAERPSVGLEVARQLGILEQLHPELAVLDKIGQEPEWHPEGNAWDHTKNAVDAAARIVREEGLEGNDELIVLLGTLCSYLGQSTAIELTDFDQGEAGTGSARRFLSQLKIINDIVYRVIPIIRERFFINYNSDPTDKQIHELARRLVPANIRLWDLVNRSRSNSSGKEFQSKTATYEIFERARLLGITESPAKPIVQGRDLISHLNMEPGPAFGQILAFLYDAQISGEFTTVEEGIAYYKSHQRPS